MAHWLDRPKGDAAADAVKTLVVRQDRNEQSQLVDPRELPVEERLAAVRARPGPARPGLARALLT